MTHGVGHTCHKSNARHAASKLLSMTSSITSKDIHVKFGEKIVSPAASQMAPPALLPILLPSVLVSRGKVRPKEAFWVGADPALFMRLISSRPVMMLPI